MTVTNNPYFGVSILSLHVCTVEPHTILCLPDNELSSIVDVDCKGKRSEVVSANVVPASGGLHSERGDLRDREASTGKKEHFKQCAGGGGATIEANNMMRRCSFTLMS